MQQTRRPTSRAPPRSIRHPDKSPSCPSPHPHKAPLREHRDAPCGLHYGKGRARCPPWCPGPACRRRARQTGGCRRQPPSACARAWAVPPPRRHVARLRSPGGGEGDQCSSLYSAVPAHWGVLSSPCLLGDPWAACRRTVSQARKAPLPSARLVMSLMARRVQLSPIMTLE